MILTGDAIHKAVEAKEINIDPYDPAQLGANSYDLRLGKGLKVYDLAPTDGLIRSVVIDGPDGEPQRITQPTFIDPSQPHLPLIDLELPDDGFVLQPGRLYLAHTVERAGSDVYVPMIEGRSSWARLGLFVHVTAGFGDLGFNGQWTLELTAIHPIRVIPGVRICQLYFHKPVGDVTRLYEGKYRESQGAMASMAHTDPESKADYQRRLQAAQQGGDLGQALVGALGALAQQAEVSNAPGVPENESESETEN